jgi:hypothetical protein
MWDSGLEVLSRGRPVRMPARPTSLLLHSDLKYNRLRASANRGEGGLLVRRTQDARSSGELLILPNEGVCLCPRSHHTSSSPFSGNSSSHWCPRVEWTIHFFLAATAPAYRIGRSSRSWLRCWSSAAPTRGSLMRRVRLPRCVAGAIEWIAYSGVMDELREIALDAYDKFLGLRLADVAVDCCITKAPCGGEKAGRSSV